MIHYCTAIVIESAATKDLKRIYLYVSVLISLAVLVLLKYVLPSTYVSVHNEEWFKLNSGFYTWPTAANFIMPVGMSFYTLQAISYTIDVSNGLVPAQRHFGRFALFMAYFPKLILGPIERASNFFGRLDNKVVFNKEGIISGMRLILWGYFKKLVIADNIAVIIDPVYLSPAHLSAHNLAIAFILYPMQLYADFSGYIDIARGCSRMLGIELSANFNLPFFTTSITAFWARWTMTISSWFRDYVLYPIYLLLKRTNVWQIKSPITKHNISFVFSLIIMFLMLGLWHGINPTFTLVSMMQVLFIITETYLPLFPRKSPYRNYAIVRIFYVLKTYLLVCFIALFFRSENIYSGWAYLEHLFVTTKLGNVGFSSTLAPYFCSIQVTSVFLLLNIIIMMLGEYLMTKRRAANYIFSHPIIYLSIYITIVMFILHAGITHKSEGFQYLQF